MIIRPPTSPKSTSTSDTETLTPQSSKPFKDRFGNQICVSSEEGQRKETFEESLEDIDGEVCIRNSVYDIWVCESCVFITFCLKLTCIIKYCVYKILVYA